MTALDFAGMQSWLDRRESRVECLGVVPAQCLAATLNLPDAPEPGWRLPAMWQGIYFLDRTPSNQLGEDGSPRDQSTMPPIPLEQVMWAGADYELFEALELGESVRKTTRISGIEPKEGTRGPMVFVTFESEYEQRGKVALLERTRAVFLGAAKGGASQAPRTERPVERQMQWPVDEALLFRFSALTFNAHRIHYDLRYTTQVAAYPGLVVHGPLQALMIAETFRRWNPDKTIRRAEFRARSPLYCGEPVTVCAGSMQDDAVALWTRSLGGGVAMDGLIVASQD